MQKDVIYIDVEDDITAIIGKIKAAQHKIVALVPPKRSGAIQSAVNLKLVHRAAEQAGKRLVLISNNAALIALAGSTGIPVARNLQSKPEMAEIPAIEVDDDDDIIDGAELPVGDHVALGAASAAPVVGAAAVAAAGKSNNASGIKKSLATPLAAASAMGNKVKVPNFDTFRKKLFLGAGCAALLVVVLVWAFVFAPSAKVIVTARTTDAALKSNVILDPAGTTDLKAGVIKVEVKTSKKDISLPFTATGKKEVGEKAVGEVKFSKQSLTATSVPAGTKLTSASSMAFVTDSAVTVPASNFGGGCFPTACPGSITVGVTATERGTTYNGVSGSMSGAPDGVSASLTVATSGGTDKTVTVVQQGDVDNVSSNVSVASDSDAAKKALASQFGNDYIVLDGSFKADAAGVKPTPAVDSEAADGKGVLGGSVVYSLTAVSKAQLTKYLDAYFAQQIDGRGDQKVYSNGANSASFTNIQSSDAKYTGTISTNGKVGPKIDENALKNYAKGKRLGDVQAYLKQVDGVEDVDVKFSPFWVSSAPNDINKIKVEFKVNGA